MQLNPTIAHQVVVVFQMQLAFQRDFKWGAFYGQQWRDLSGSSNNTEWQERSTTFSKWDDPGAECTEEGVTCFPRGGSPTTDYISEYQIKFPNRQGTSPGVDMVPVDAPVMCRSPLHKVLHMHPQRSSRCCPFHSADDAFGTQSIVMRCIMERGDITTRCIV